MDIERDKEDIWGYIGALREELRKLENRIKELEKI